MTDQHRKLFEEILKFLKYEKEVFGDFAVGSERSGRQEQPVDQSTQTPDDQPVESKRGFKPEPSAPPRQKEEEPNIQETGAQPASLFEKHKQPAHARHQPGEQKSPLESCSTLEDLKTICEKSDELRTDLEGTNLVFGVGNPRADLMLIGEAPGYYEDQKGEPFVGRAGQLLDKILEAIDFQRDEVYIANILKHRPPDNRDPKPEERQRSLPYLKRQIELIDPKLILCLGLVSATTLLDRNMSLRDMRGRFHPFMDRLLMVTYHPAALLRNRQWKRPAWEDVQLLREKYDELVG